MTVDKFWDLLSKKISGEASDAESLEFEEILQSNPDWKNTADTLNQLWRQSIPSSQIETDNSFDVHIERMKKQGVEINEFHQPDEFEIFWEAEKNRKRKQRRWILSAVGTMATALTVFLLIRNNNSSAVPKDPAGPLSQVITKPGSTTQIQLPDGSKVWLNASSNLTYDKDFGKNQRVVNLSGEAFFDVVKDPAHPFIIHTQVIDVKVLGTQFNVRSYPNDANTETSLIKGSVEVTVKNRDEKYYLKPNEKVVIANNILNVPGMPPLDGKSALSKSPEAKPLISIQPLNYYRVDSTILETSWVENRLLFQENESFKEVALKMERRYGVKISFKSEKVAEYRPFGSFTKETITQALDALQVGFRFNYKKDGDNITISE